ncbi:hypothetical protein TNCV_746831 [Trichonephila clavipes]|nr:hypothetical protein TNCV_746831 [Trichonephila clavipes]
MFHDSSPNPSTDVTETRYFTDLGRQIAYSVLCPNQNTSRISVQTMSGLLSKPYSCGRVYSVSLNMLMAAA